MHYQGNVTSSITREAYYMTLVIFKTFLYSLQKKSENDYYLRIEQMIRLYCGHRKRINKTF